MAKSSARSDLAIPISSRLSLSQCSVGQKVAESLRESLGTRLPELVRKVCDISVPFTNWIRVASREKFGNWPQIMNSKFIASSEAATHCGHFKYVVLIYSCNNIAMIILVVATKLCWFQYTLW